MKSLFHILISCFLFLFSISCIAQKESNNWYFGNTCGVNFSSGSPVAVTNGAMNAIEGCSAISDTGGNLLFYTDGVSVWNRNHVLMPNGNTTLNGSGAATQNAIIVPKPNDPTHYYIFTIDADGGVNGLSYSEVDMTLAGGMGDIILPTINTQLVTPTAEKVTAVKHYNLRDYWVVTHKWNSTEFDAFLVTPSGINPVPVSTLIGSTHGGASTSFSHGYMKASSDGSKIGLAITGPNAANTKAEVFDFDNTTGVLSNAVSLSGFALTVYGVEFSPDSRLFYVSTSSNPVNIHQFNLYAGSPALINASGQVPVATSPGFVYAMQLGLNKKIYGCRFNTSFLSEIADPNVIGVGCNFTANAIPLAGRLARIGLPNFIQGDFIHANYNYTDTCINDTTKFFLEFAGIADSVRWDFNDPASGNNTSTLDTTYHIFSAPGNYTVSVIVHVRSLTDTVIKTVHVMALPQVNLGNDTTLCQGQTIDLDASSSGATAYLWHNNSTASSFRVDTTGTYLVLVTLYGCKGRDTIHVTVNPVPVVNLRDTTICDHAAPFQLNAFVLGSTYLWQDGSTASIFNVSLTGNYTVTVTQNNCSTSDQANITINTSPVINFGLDTSICTGQFIDLDASASGATSYLWQNNSTASSFHVDTTGSYFVVATLNGCIGSDTIHVTVNQLPIANIRDTTICDGVLPYQLNVFNSGATYLWQDGSTAATFNVLLTGAYTVTVTNNNCSSSDQASVTINTSPQINLGPDTSICTGQFINLNVSSSGATSYLWQNNSTAANFHVDTTGTYFVIATLNNCSASDTVHITVNQLPVASIRDTTICDGALPYQLNAFNAGANYLWQDGSTASTFTVLQTGTYTITVTQNNCSSTDQGNITVNVSPHINLGNDTALCEGQFVDLFAGPLTVTYLWQNGSTANTFHADTTGTYSVVATSNGCTGTDTIRIAVNSNPIVSIGPDTTFCEGLPFHLTAQNSPATYLWQNGVTTQSVNVTQSGTYIVTVTQNNCISHDTAIVTLSPKPIVVLGNDTTLCEGFQLFYNVTNANCQYQWNDGYTGSTRFVDTLGIFAVTVTSVDGCSTNDAVTIDLQFEPLVYLGEDTSLCFGQPIKLDATNYGATYQWQDGSTGTTFAPIFTGIYGVSATNQCGIANDSIRIDFRDCNCLVYLPKAFTPNSDGKNELFNFKYDCTEFTVYMRIYNRIGQLMFYSNNPDLGWDGKYNGNAAEEGVYVYQLHYSGFGNGKLDEKTERGTFILLR